MTVKGTYHVSRRWARRVGRPDGGEGAAGVPMLPSVVVSDLVHLKIAIVRGVNSRVEGGDGGRLKARRRLGSTGSFLPAKDC